MFGYKGFIKGLENRYGKKFEVGKTYRTSGDVDFGNEGKGYHFCRHLSDVFRFFSPEEVEVALIFTGDEGDDLVSYDDDYNGYYEMYSCRSLTIEKILSREEIIKIMLLEQSPYNVEKFIKTFPLSDNELMLFRNKDNIIKEIIDNHYGIKEELRERGGL